MGRSDHHDTVRYRAATLRTVTGQRTPQYFLASRPALVVIRAITVVIVAGIAAHAIWRFPPRKTKSETYRGKHRPVADHRLAGRR